MLATFHRPPILAAVGLLAAALARMPRHDPPAPVVPAFVEGCPTTPIAIPPVIESPNLIYIDSSNDSKMIFTPPDRAPTLR
jgi:hypothetical protein